MKESAFPHKEDINHWGLSKQEYACIHLGIPKSGNKDLDELIKESNQIKIAGQALQGLTSLYGVTGLKPPELEGFALGIARRLLKELDKK